MGAGGREAGFGRPGAYPGFPGFKDFKIELARQLAAARLIASASRIAVCGLRGSAGALAGEPHNRLVRLGLSSAAYADGHMRRMSAPVPQRGGVGVFISLPGGPVPSLRARNLPVTAGRRRWRWQTGAAGSAAGSMSACTSDPLKPAWPWNNRIPCASRGSW